MPLTTLSGFKRGDYIEVTPLERLHHGNADFGTVRGTALTDLGPGGSSVFTIQVLMGGRRHDLELNCNDVDVRLLFSAAVARGE